MPEVLDWRTADPGQIAKQATEALRAGRLVAFPTETVYGVAASAGHADGAARLARSKGRDADKPLTMAIGGPHEALDWLPDLGRAGRRLSSRAWPGPLTLVSDEGASRGVLAQFSETVQRHVCPAGAIGLRAPRHDAIQRVMRSLGPLLLTSANPSGRSEATSAGDVRLADERDLAYVIDDGKSPLGQPSTVVKVSGNQWEVLRAGALAQSELPRLAGCYVLFVCTGNTCRSAIAEGLLKKMLADRLSCRVEDLPARGFTIRSAGLAVFGGNPAAPDAVMVAGERGADLRAHKSRIITNDLIDHADFILAMTHGHLDLLRDLFGPDIDARARLLDPDGREIADPIGYERPVYDECARQINQALERLLPEVLLG